MVFKITTQAEMVAYPHRDATLVCDASEHILRSHICLQDLKIQFEYKSNLTSVVSELANHKV